VRGNFLIANEWMMIMIRAFNALKKEGENRVKLGLGDSWRG